MSLQIIIMNTLKNRRKQLKISINELARRVKSKPEIIDKYERAQLKPTENKLKIILKELSLENSFTETEFKAVSKPNRSVIVILDESLDNTELVMKSLDTEFFSSLHRLKSLTGLTKNQLSIALEKLINIGEVDIEYFKDNARKGRANVAYRKADI